MKQYQAHRLPVVEDNGRLVGIVSIDFVLYGNRGFLAIEVKRGRRVSQADVAGLRSFVSDYPSARAILIYSGDRRLNVGGVDTRPLGDFLKRLPEILQE